jgi:hypothetical protein
VLLELKRAFKNIQTKAAGSGSFSFVAGCLVIAYSVGKLMGT